MKRDKGFTLIEILIVIAIIGIVSSIAYPSYQSFMVKARRGDAQAELIKAQLTQTGLHILSPEYSQSAAELGLPSAHEYYDFSVASAGSTTYLLKAVAKVGTTQASDEAQCTTLFIDQDSFRSKDGTVNNDACW